jgi:hypothetical protein
MGQDLVNGLTQGMQDQAGDAARAAANISAQIIAAFGKAGGTGAAKKNIEDLAAIYGDLSKMFKSIGSAERVSSQVDPAQIAVMATMLGDIEGPSKQLANHIRTLDKTFKDLKSGPIKDMAGNIGNLAIFMNNLTDANRSFNRNPLSQLEGMTHLLQSIASSHVLPDMIYAVDVLTAQILTPTRRMGGIMGFNVPGQVGGNTGPLKKFAGNIGNLAIFMNNLTDANRSFNRDPLAQLEGMTKLLQSIAASGVIGRLMEAVFFLELQMTGTTLATGSPGGRQTTTKHPGLTFSGSGQVMKTADFKSFAGAIGNLAIFMNELTDVARSFNRDPVGQLTGINNILHQIAASNVIGAMAVNLSAIELHMFKDTGITGLTKTFKDVGALFDQIASTSASANKVTGGGVASITSSFSKIVTGLADSVTSGTPHILFTFMQLGSQIQKFFTQTLIPDMKTWGTDMMVNLSEGINAGVKQVSPALTLAGLSAGSTLGSAVSAGASLTTNYYIEGVNVGANNPAQFAQQMQQQSRMANATGGSKRA